MVAWRGEWEEVSRRSSLYADQGAPNLPEWNEKFIESFR